MPVTKEPASDAEVTPRKVKPSSKYRVRRVTPEGNDPVVFTTEDKGIARKHVKDNYHEDWKFTSSTRTGTGNITPQTRSFKVPTMGAGTNCSMRTWNRWDASIS